MVSLGLVILGLSGCKDVTTEGYTGITYYPTIEIKGDPVIYLPTGADYNDAGADAIENGEPTDVAVSSNLDTSTPGSYSISYTATNADGFSATAKRSVIVYDANMSTTDISGTYSAHVIRDNDPDKEYSGNPVTLTPSSIPGTTGIYETSDWIGGFYDKGYDYGAAYAFTGLIQINGDNEVLELSMSNPWGDPFTSVSGIYDAVSGVISYTAVWSAGPYEFVVDLAK